MALVAPESNALVEENHHGSCSNLIFKPTESSTQIDSISIDLVDTDNEVKLGDCKHFCIRGYVSEVRGKDWKKCWPFDLDNDPTMSDENHELPPLHVPKFRWWHCQSCLNDDGEGLVNADGSASAKSDKFKSGFCPYLSSHNFSLKELPDSSSLKMIDSRKFDASSFVDINRNACHHSLCDNMRATKTEKGNTPVIGHAVGSQDHRKKKTPVLNCASTVLLPSIHQQTDQTDHAVVACNATHEHPHVTLQNAAEAIETVKEKSSHGEQTDLLCIAHKESKTAGSVSGGVQDCKINHPPLELDDHDNASETAEILHGTPLGCSHRRKTRKVRLLTELLAKSGVEKTHLLKGDDSSLRALSELSVGETLVSSPGVLVGFQRDVTGSLVRQSRKRDLPMDEEWGSLNTSSTSKKVRTLNFNRDWEDTDARINSNLEGTFTRVGSQTGMESRLISFKADRGPNIGKKKNKKVHGFTRHMPLTAAQENVQPEASTKAGDAVKNNLFKLGDAPITGKALDPFPSSLQKVEKRSFSSKKKGKILEHDGVTYPDLLNNGIEKEGSTSRRVVETKQIKSISVPLMSTHDISPEKGLHFSFNNCLPAQRYDRNYVPPTRDELSLLPWPGKILGKDEHISNDFQMNYVRDPRFSSSSEMGVHIWGGAHSDPNCRMPNYGMPCPKEKQLPSTLAEIGSHSMVHQIDYCGPSNNSRPIETQEHSAVARRYGKQGVDFVAEQGASDDIPMEIVELMAKHQFERRLPDAETDKHFTEAKYNSRSYHRLDLNKAYGNEELLSLLQEEISHETKSLKNARTGSAASIDNMAFTKLKPVDCLPRLDRNPYDMSQSKHIFGPNAFRLFAECGESPPNGVQYSGNSAQNCRWNRNTVECKSQSPHDTMFSQRPCNTCQTAQQSKEGAQFWSSMIPNNIPIPFPFNMMPQRSAEQSISEEAPFHSYSFDIKGNTNEADGHLSIDSSKPEKDERKADSNVLRRMHADCPLACKHSNSDIYELSPHEVVPAMHLLSLMDPGICSDTTVNVDGNQKFLKRPPFLHDHLSKECSSLPCSGYKTVNDMKHPSYDNYGSGKTLMSDNIGECLPVIPMVGASIFRQNRSFKDTNFKGEVSLKHWARGKMKCLDSGMQNIGCRKCKSASSNCGSDTTCGSIPVHSMPKLVLGTKELMSSPMQFHIVGSTSKQNLMGLAINSVFPSPKCSASEICSINRNPADFTDPEAGNIYMIRGEDLKPAMAINPDDRPCSTKLVGHKRQRRFAAAKEHSRNQTH